MSVFIDPFNYPPDHPIHQSAVQLVSRSGRSGTFRINSAGLDRELIRVCAWKPHAIEVLKDEHREDILAVVTVNDAGHIRVMEGRREATAGYYPNLEGPEIKQHIARLMEAFRPMYLQLARLGFTTEN